MSTMNSWFSRFKFSSGLSMLKMAFRQPLWPSHEILLRSLKYLQFLTFFKLKYKTSLIESVLNLRLLGENAVRCCNEELVAKQRGSTKRLGKWEPSKLGQIRELSDSGSAASNHVGGMGRGCMYGALT